MLKIKKEVKIGLLILIITIIIFMFFLEIFLRIFVKTYDFRGETILDDELGYTLNKSFSAIQRTKDGDKINLTINRCGFRSNFPDSCYFKSNSSYKILVLGDSFTYGRGVNNNETYSYYLENFLQNTEVLNAGISGYGPDQELLYLKKILKNSNPDLVILGFYDNDISDIGKFSILFNQPKNSTNYYASFYNLKNYLRDSVRVYAFFTSAITNIRPLRVWLTQKGILSREVYEVYSIYANNPPDYFKKYYSQTEEIIIEMDSLSNDFLLVYLPSRLHFSENQRKDAEYFNLKFINSTTNVFIPNLFLKNISEENNINFIDPTSYFVQIYDETNLYLKKDGHFSKEGNYEIAKIIKDYLIAKNLSI